MRLVDLGLAALSLIACLATPARAADEPESCPRLVASGAPRFQRAALAGTELSLTFVGHATFLIETPGGIRIATDYNDYVRPRVTPDVATMNKAHSTHYSNNPDPGIGTILRGWNPAGGPAIHNVVVGDARVRNVNTNIRDWGGGTEYNGNSIFIFEAAGLCVAHLGHLHHELTEDHLKQMGRIDVTLAPVDGSYTLDMDGMMRVLKAIGSPLVIPMHAFSQTTLRRFLSIAGASYAIEDSATPTIVVSRETLPTKPTIRVLPSETGR